MNQYLYENEYFGLDPQQFATDAEAIANAKNIASKLRHSYREYRGQDLGSVKVTCDATGLNHTEQVPAVCGCQYC